MSMTTCSAGNSIYNLDDGSSETENPSGRGGIRSPRASSELYEAGGSSGYTGREMYSDVEEERSKDGSSQIAALDELVKEFRLFCSTLERIPIGEKQQKLAKNLLSVTEAIRDIETFLGKLSNSKVAENAIEEFAKRLPSTMEVVLGILVTALQQDDPSTPKLHEHVDRIISTLKKLQHWQEKWYHSPTPDSDVHTLCIVDWLKILKADILHLQRAKAIVWLSRDAERA